jgi:type II restriction enzyme
MKRIRPALLTASGLSDKALNHLQDSDKDQAIAELIHNFLDPAGANFVEELVFRFLLTRGDTLGGSMRNVGGFIAQCRLSRAVIACLRISGEPVHMLQGKSKKWVLMPAEDADFDRNLRGLSWSVDSNKRSLLFNLGVPLVNNNIDLCLFDCSLTDLKKAVVAPERYVALGELKGGIDPAGADEHWKTARSALNRIEEAFATRKLKPHLFYVGGAIEAKMANEIWDWLKTGKLKNAANLTVDDQLASIARWICSI